jgi:hypothetical protein
MSPTVSYSLEVAASAGTHRGYWGVVGTLGWTSLDIIDCCMLIVAGF